MTTVQSLNHIGIAVHSIEDARGYYEDTLGAQFEGKEDIPDQHVRVAFFRLANVRLELLESTSSEGPVAKFLAKRGEGLHHIALTVEDIQTRIDELKALGIQMIDDQPRIGAHQMQIAFVHPNSTHGVLTELCEDSNSEKAPDE